MASEAALISFLAGAIVSGMTVNYMNNRVILVSEKEV